MALRMAVLPERYQDAQLVAIGGMGEVYRAVDRALGRTVAVKVLDDRHAADPTVRERFTREALAAARLSSEPGIVMIFDVGEHAGHPFIVMEYLPGGTLQDVLAREGAQAPARALQWLAEAADALDRAHARGIVHRDVKPGNLLLDAEGEVHVADFGVASAAGMASLTQTGTVIGTAGYLSPEQAQGSPATPASDRYALAVVAWELLAGVRPFANTNPAAEATAHVWSPVPSLAAKRPGIPPSVDAVFARALAKNPATRFPSSRAFVAALQAAFTQVSAPTTVITRTTAPPVVVRRRRSSGLLLPLLVLLALGAAGIAAAVIVANRGSSPAPARVVRVTVTRAGRTVQRTVTAQPTAPASPSAATTITTVTTTPSTTTPSSTTPSSTTTTTLTTTSSAPAGASAASQGYARMQAGDYAGAVPLLEQAAQDLQGSNSLDEAYNDFNLALSLAKTQGCSPQVLQLLDASQAIQGHRGPIDELRAACTAPVKKAKKH